MTAHAWLPAAIAGLTVACNRAPVPAAAAEDTATPASALSLAPSATTATEPVEWQLTATPATTFPMAERGTFQLWIVAHNTGAVPADTERHRLAFQVNGKGSHSLSMAFGNGLRERRWSPLAPGDTVREARGGPTDPAFGEGLFPSPGDYELGMLQGERVLATLKVRVVAGR